MSKNGHVKTEKSDDTEAMLKALSKEELCTLIRNKGFLLHVTERDIRWVQHEYLTAKAAAMSNEALSEMKHYDSVEYPGLRRKAERKFDKAMKLYDRANALISC